MTANTLKAIVAMLAIGLASVTVTEAGPRHAKGHHQKYDKKYSKKYFKKDPLIVAAFDVEDSARFLHYRAEELAHHGTFWEKRALVRLHRLEREAREFRRALWHYGPAAARTQNELYELESEFARTKRAFRGLHAYGDVRREMHRLDVLMDDLRYRLQRRLARHDRHDPHDRRAYPTRDGSYGHVQLGKTWRNGHASVGFSWDDEYDD